MATFARIAGSVRRAGLALTVTCIAALLLVGALSTAPRGHPAALGAEADLDGSALPVSGQPAPGSIEATFTKRSYAPGEKATLRIATSESHLAVRLFSAGRGDDGPMHGAPVSRPVRLSRDRRVAIVIGEWPSGLYYARLTAAKERTGYAPFVVRPRLGEHRVAVVLPTNTWQAYNFYDEDGDGRADSWYPNPRVTCVHLARPFLDHGVPPHYRGYDDGFIRWLRRSGIDTDFLTDDDMERTGDGDTLASRYDLIVFSGHEEYVTRHAYDIVERYRNLGGNLMFLSSNNFFYRVDHHGDRICRTGRWRDLGRPEVRLVGVQYVDWYQGHYKNRPYLVTGARRVPWAFVGTGLRDGDRFGTYGIEIDDVTRDSPRDIRVLARISDIFGPGESAEMTYYTTTRGAKVFAAGTMNFGGSALWPIVSPLMRNLFRQLTKP
jgi:hypothetical protein